jgi:hypothetical protein
MKRRRVDGTRPERRHDPRGAAWLAVLIMTVAAGLPRPAATQSEGSWDNINQLRALATAAGAGASLPSYPTLYRAPPPAGRRQ